MYIGGGLDTNDDGQNDLYVFGRVSRRSQNSLNNALVWLVLVVLLGCFVCVLYYKVVLPFRFKWASRGYISTADANLLAQGVQHQQKYGESFCPDVIVGSTTYTSLRLRDVSDISLDGARVLAEIESCEIQIAEMKSISPAVAKALARGSDGLLIRGLRELSAEVAESLAKTPGRLALYGLTTLSDEAAKALAQHKGELSISDLPRLSDKVAKAIAQHEGYLTLHGLTTLSDEAAKALAQHKGDLVLFGLTTLSDDAAAALRANPGIRLPDEFEK